MFNNNSTDNEADFCESYKSQILGKDKSEKGSSLFSSIVKLLTILMLLVIIVGVSFYGYNYFMNSQKMNSTILPPISMQVSDDDLLVTMEEEIEPEEKIIIKKEERVIKEKNISIPLPVIVSPQVEEEDIETIANNVKIAIAKIELEEENETKTEEKVLEEITSIEENLEVPSSAPEAKYLEQLADLSKEIDKEKNQ